MTNNSNWRLLHVVINELVRFVKHLLTFSALPPPVGKLLFILTVYVIAMTLFQDLTELFQMVKILSLIKVYLLNI